jgi:hypothetical protein
MGDFHYEYGRSTPPFSFSQNQVGVPKKTSTLMRCSTSEITLSTSFAWKLIFLVIISLSSTMRFGRFVPYYRSEEPLCSSSIHRNFQQVRRSTSAIMCLRRHITYFFRENLDLSHFRISSCNSLFRPVTLRTLPLVARVALTLR